MAMYGNLLAVRAGTLDGLDHNFVSKRADVGFQFGDPAFVDAANETDIVAPDSTDASLKFQGVAVHTYYSDRDVEGEYPENHMVPVCTGGEIWVKVVAVDTAIIANTPAYVIDLTSDGNYKAFTDLAGANTYGPIGYFTSNAVTVGAVKFAKIVIDGIK